MGSARVQYALERTLPQLTWLESTGQFSKSELQQVTSSRSKHEQSLIRRGVTREDFHRYIAFEDDFESLRLLREERLSRPISVKESAKARADAIRTLINIYERGCKRLRGDVMFWEEYIAWSLAKGMRIVSGRIIARALAMFPNAVRLWLRCADWQLNVNGAPNAARALLQRAIRLNARPHLSSIGSGIERPSKRQRTSSNRSTLSQLHQQQSQQSLVPQANISKEEEQVLSLWIEYIRMELVFLERVRRRRKVLGISMDEEKAPDAATTLQDESGHSEMEQAVLKDVPAADDAQESNSQVIAAQNAASAAAADARSGGALIVQGAIPISIMRAALALDSPTSLPPRTHLRLLLSLHLLFRSFPFLSSSSGECGPRTHLLEALRTTVEDRFKRHEVVELLRGSDTLLDKAFVLELQEDEEEEAGGWSAEGQKPAQTLLGRASTLSTGGASPELLLLDSVSRRAGLHALLGPQETYGAALIVLQLSAYAFKVARGEKNSSTARLLQAPIEAFRKILTSESIGQLDASGRSRLVKCVIALHLVLGNINTSSGMTNTKGKGEADTRESLDAEVKTYLRAATSRLIKSAERLVPISQLHLARLEVQVDEMIDGRGSRNGDLAGWKRVHDDACRATNSSAKCAELSSDDLLGILRIRLWSVRASPQDAPGKGAGRLGEEWERVFRDGGESVWKDAKLVEERCEWLASALEGASKVERDSLRKTFEEDLRKASRHPESFLLLAKAYLSSGVQLKRSLTEQTNQVLMYAPSNSLILYELFTSALARFGLATPSSSILSPSSSSPSAAAAKTYEALDRASKASLDKLLQRLSNALNKPAVQRTKTFLFVATYQRDVKRDLAGANETLRRACKVLGSSSRQWLERQWVANTGAHDEWQAEAEERGQDGGESMLHIRSDDDAEEEEEE